MAHWKTKLTPAGATEDALKQIIYQVDFLLMMVLINHANERLSHV